MLVLHREENKQDRNLIERTTPSAIKTQHLPNLINKISNVTLESHIANVTSEAIPQKMTISYKISS